MARRRQPRAERVEGRRADPAARYGILPLRLFLGATFVYAGVQKLSDPGFLAPGSPTYIGSQLQSYSAHSPIGFLLQTFAIPLGPLTGAAVIAAELVVGVLVLLGLYTRHAAAAGALLNFVLFLTATWQVQPYFLGSDTIYTVAWITLALTGDQGVFSLQPRWDAWYRPEGGDGQAVDPGRRAFLVQAGAAAVGLVWILAILPRAQGRAKLSPAPSSPAPTTPSPGASAPSGSPAPGTAIGTLNQMQSNGGSLTYQDPASGDPALAVDLGGSQVVAYDAVCTHAGCTVQYDSPNKVIFCPCHGAVYDPAHGAQVLQGPAPAPLAQLKVRVAQDGTVYAET